MNKREIKYDYLRTLAVFAIIMVHAIPAETLNYKQWLFAAALQPVLLVFVGIYFMLSGLFLLETGTEDIVKFYKNRFTAIFMPFVLYSSIYYWYYEVYLSPEKKSWYRHLRAFLERLVEGTIPNASHMWFMYVILSLYLCAPFLARLLKALTDKDLKIFLIVMLTVQGFITYGPAFGLFPEAGLQYMVFKGWLIYFVLGYILKRLYRNSRYVLFAVLGTAGFFITMAQKLVMPAFLPDIHDLALTMIAMAAAIFMFFEKFGHRFPVMLENTAFFISKHSYSLYLIHYLILGQFAEQAVGRSEIRHYYVPKVISVTLLTFLLSLVFAWIMDETVIKLLKNKMSGCKNRHSKKQKERGA